MTDRPLVQPAAEPSPARRRLPLVPIVLVVVALALLAAGAGWWLTSGRQTASDWDRLADIDLSAPAGDAFAAGTPWVRLQFKPARPGEANALRLSLDPRGGTPVAGAAVSPRITGLTAQPLLVAGAAPAPVELQPEGDGAFAATIAPDRGGWWRLSATVEGLSEPRIVSFHLLLPDPNINGPGAVARPATSSEGGDLFAAAENGITSLRSVRFVQWIADGRGNAAVSEHAVTAGGDGAPPAFSYRAVGGMEAVVIGSTRWIRTPGTGEWQQQEGAVVVPPAEWGEEYLGATEFVLGPEEEIIAGEPCRLVAFLAPDVTEPRRRVAAWYLWWVGTESGHVRQEVMVSRLHYMHNDFSAFDEPIHLTPPQEAAATPVAGATPAA